MKKYVILLLAGTLLFSACKKNDSSSYTNQLTLGTGISASNAFQLTGTGTSFSVTPGTIYWKLESADDMAGSTVIIKLEKKSGGTYSVYDNLTFSNPQSYGHIMLSYFMLTSTGQYKATGILQTGNKTISFVEFTMN
jgi:hypothetical protein